MIWSIILAVFIGKINFISFFFKVIFIFSSFFYRFVVDYLALTNTQLVSTQTKSPRAKPNLFDPVLSADVYIGHLKENEQIVQLQPRLAASDADSSKTVNGMLTDYYFSSSSSFRFFVKCLFTLTCICYLL